jgi:hypothetical protein
MVVAYTEWVCTTALTSGEMEGGLGGGLQLAFDDLAVEGHHHHIGGLQVEVLDPGGLDRHQAFGAVVDAEVAARTGGQVGGDHFAPELDDRFAFCL